MNENGQNSEGSLNQKGGGVYQRKGAPNPVCAGSQNPEPGVQATQEPENKQTASGECLLREPGAMEVSVSGTGSGIALDYAKLGRVVDDALQAVGTPEEMGPAIAQKVIAASGLLEEVNRLKATIGKVEDYLQRLEDKSRIWKESIPADSSDCSRDQILAFAIAETGETIVRDIREALRRGGK